MDNPTPSTCIWLFSLHEIDEERLSTFFKNTEKISKKFHKTPHLSVVFFLNQLYLTTQWPHNFMHSWNHDYSDSITVDRSFLYLTSCNWSSSFYLCTLFLFGLNRIIQYRLFYLTSFPQHISRFTFIATGISLLHHMDDHPLSTHHGRICNVSSFGLSQLK